MATWKRLTDTNQRKIDVNVDSVAYLHPFEKHTAEAQISEVDSARSLIRGALRVTPKARAPFLGGKAHTTRDITDAKWPAAF
jgi:hypothetical protein